MFDKWKRIALCGATHKSSAMLALECPAAARVSTSRSRGVSTGGSAVEALARGRGGAGPCTEGSTTNLPAAATASALSRSAGSAFFVRYAQAPECSVGMTMLCSSGSAARQHNAATRGDAAEPVVTSSVSESRLLARVEDDDAGGGETRRAAVASSAVSASPTTRYPAASTNRRSERRNEGQPSTRKIVCTGRRGRAGSSSTRRHYGCTAP